MRIALIILLVLWSTVALADSLIVPFSCWPLELQQEFAKTGRKLDIRSENRTSDSWGYVVNEGSSYKIFTYRSTTPEDFQVIQDIVFKIEIEKRKE